MTSVVRCRCLYRSSILTLVLFFVLSHTTLCNNVYKVDEQKSEEGEWERERKVDRLKRIAKVVQFSIVNILCGYLLRGKVLVLYTHIYLLFFSFVCFCCLFFSSCYEFYALTDYRSDLQWIQIEYKLSSAWSTTEFVKFRETNWTVIEIQCLYKDIITWPFDFSPFHNPLSQCAVRYVLVCMFTFLFYFFFSVFCYYIFIHR